MIHVISQYIYDWFKRYPNTHRTDQQGQRIICPQVRERGYPAEVIHERPSHITRCPMCKAKLGHVEAITDKVHPGEFTWPTAA